MYMLPFFVGGEGQREREREQNMIFVRCVFEDWIQKMMVFHFFLILWSEK